MRNQYRLDETLHTAAQEHSKQHKSNCRRLAHCIAASDWCKLAQRPLLQDRSVTGALVRCAQLHMNELYCEDICVLTAAFQHESGQQLLHSKYAAVCARSSHSDTHTIETCFNTAALGCGLITERSVHTAQQRSAAAAFRTIKIMLRCSSAYTINMT
eukprot:12733-Heterococcus_DN1.PRE.12